MSLEPSEMNSSITQKHSHDLNTNSINVHLPVHDIMV